MFNYFNSEIVNIMNFLFLMKIEDLKGLIL